MPSVSEKQKQLAADALSGVVAKTTEADAVQLQRFREHIVRQLDGDNAPTAFGCFRGPDKIVKTALDKSRIADAFTGVGMITVMFDANDTILFYNGAKWETR